MHLMYFTEQPFSSFPEDAARDFGQTTLLFSNRYFDAEVASRLYNERLEEYLYAEECGVDGIMLNEHHNAPFCMQAKIHIFASILAAATKRVKIVLLGNPLPVSDNPVRIAEELAMIDLISKGRIVSGFVRGGGVEALATNTNPVYNRDRFVEAHDLILKTWTTPGPFRWEGEHYQMRVVNPWVLPMQRPFPRVWIPGISSKETIVFAAERAYPYIALNTTIDDTLAIWKIYDQAAKAAGYQAGPEHRGYLSRCQVAETEEKAMALARQFLWMQGEYSMSNPAWVMPSGYLGAWARRTVAQQHAPAGKRTFASFEQQLASGQLIAGTPSQVVAKLRVVLEKARPSVLALWGNDGRVSHQDSMTCIRLLGQEVMPALREIGKSLGLDSPFEKNSPVSLSHAGSVT
ncbi:MAG: LLM class flavin-dependent oxidoreductase [Chloroflexi bacterium]|nr:LLM class flavin-dependent oxidoreductase [Chloroflexota bacterium]